MVKLSNGVYVIGFGNGYQFVKVAGVIFDNGIYPMGKIEPAVEEYSLKHEWKLPVFVSIF